MTLALMPRDEKIRKVQRLVFDIVTALVDDPAAVRLEVQADDSMTTFVLTVADRDLGKVIGKQGRTARSIRTILGASSMKYHERFALDITSGARPEETDR